MEWTDEVIERLKALWEEGLSTAEIGRRLGTTKNAVVGKAHRLKLPTRPSPIKSRRKKQEEEASSQNDLFSKKEKSQTGKIAKTSPLELKEEGGSEKPKEKKPAPKTSPSKEASLKSAGASVKEENFKTPVQEVKPQEGSAPFATVKGGESKKTAEKPQEKSVLKSDFSDVSDFEDPLLEEDFDTDSFAAEAERLRAKQKPQKTGKKEKLVPQVPRRLGLTCQWPFGDPGEAGFHFCGKKIVPGRPYCQEHCEIAYVRKMVK